MSLSRSLSLNLVILLGALAGARKPVVRDASVAPTALADLSTTSDDSKDQTHALANDGATTAGSKVSMTTGTEVEGVWCRETDNEIKRLNKERDTKAVQIARLESQVAIQKKENARLQTEAASYAEQKADLDAKESAAEAKLDAVQEAFGSDPSE